LERNAARVLRTYAWLSQQSGCQYALVAAPGATTADLIRSLALDPSVEYAVPNYIRTVYGSLHPTDTRFGELWGLHNTGQTVGGVTGLADADIDFPEAQGMSRSATGAVVVAVVDTGVDYGHPDLASNIWINPGEIPGNGIDDDGNGYVDDWHGYDFAGDNTSYPVPDSDPSDSGSHGTHVSGTIAAIGNNGIGVIGVEPHTRILALKASDDGRTVPDSAAVEAIGYAAMMKAAGVNVVAINCSFGGTGYSVAQADAIADAVSRGIVVVAAAGNESADVEVTPSYPACYADPGILSVAATDAADALASFSNYGASSVDLAAPGANVLSTVPTNVAATIAHVQTAAAQYTAATLEFSGTTTGITAVLYDCGLGYTTSFPAEVQGNVALIQRGDIYFSAKVANAMAAGAVAAVVYNHSTGLYNGTLQSPGNWIPAVALSLEDGEAIKAALGSAVTVVNRLDPAQQSYSFFDGTSMATPHVSGAIAFAARNFPAENVSQRVLRIKNAIDRLVALDLRVATGGRLNLARVVDADGDTMPDWWEADHFGGAGNGEATADPDGDGASNAEEWAAGTDPTNRASVLRVEGIACGSAGATRVQWQSVAGEFYRLKRGGSITGGLDHTVASGIPATPPLNTVTDRTATGAGPYFYRLAIEP
jgi:subtilisin family serine protease